MGPQLYRCGNPGRAGVTNRLRTSLQWGRNFIVAETSQLNTTLLQADLLQWGRNFIVAETEPLMWQRRHNILSFNGAATLSLRKRDPRNRNKERRHPASMGPQLYRCGNIERS